MTRPTKTLATGFVFLLLAAGVYSWLRNRQSPATAAVVYHSPDFTEQPLAANSRSKSPSALGSNSSVAAMENVDKKKDESIPMLRAGEVLDFTANVSKLNEVATLRLLVAGRGNLAGRPSWHLQAIAHTQNPLRMVFELDDQFDSYSDAATLASLQYEMRLNERGQKVQSVQRLSSSGKEPAPNNASIARVLPGTRDPLGMMQYLRSVDWEKTPQVRSPVYDGRKLYDVRAALAAKAEPVSVPAGKFTATKIEIKVFDNGTELKDSHFALYLDNKSAHTPVLLEAVLPFAVATVELQSAK
ncbi:MAG TPA: DUF3108 domain-containing protein [Candidatus Dormibacteraeota bacterium]|nr:DUF3108 domain-containing protein [Candidatus Dormibacteraeota bacterium]